MQRFHAPPERILWYYEANLELLEGGSVSGALLVPLEVAIDQMRALLTVGQRSGGPESPERES